VRSLSEIFPPNKSETKHIAKDGEKVINVLKVLQLENVSCCALGF